MRLLQLHPVPKRVSPLRAVRQKCLDCSGYGLKSVRECAFNGYDNELCPLSHLRMGKGSRKTMKALRSYCLWCCNGQSYEVKLCPSDGCPIWDYRFGHRPRKSNLLPKNSMTAGVLNAEPEKR